ncbi:pyruvate dehydrogenase (acetyl-transferring), homodimeric type [Buchnera aphidicola (Ceratovacuna keduensis)]|uniref:pyruvate dehydrogenase (acetyl-transferring), homodimeric type n=1 Tax=Buchnera aphidicola TaxID=9 RepID=UPI0031B829B0
MSKNCKNSIDKLELDEWILSIKSFVKRRGFLKSKFLLKKIFNTFLNLGIKHNNKSFFLTNYLNSISKYDEKKYPGNLKIEKKIRSAMRWNAIVMVVKSYKKKLELGGHISSFQSSANIYDVFFNHFFKANNKKFSGDMIYFQGHISPGIYSRAFLEDRITEEQMNNFRQEVNNNGLSSYPHPKLMPNFWQFPTVSMGLTSSFAIYQAKFLKYINNRKIKDTSSQKVYAFLGDGEMDEPESKGLINIASREKLDNLIFIINCNLQRLDGPVYGNGKIINELESFFLGSGWKVIKVIWGSDWDKLLEKDSSNKLIKLMNETLDGDYQNFRSKNGYFIRKFFFGKYVETEKLVKNMTDDEIFNLRRGGHDSIKIFNAIYKANLTKNKPVVILFHTIKGYGLGSIGESKNISHQIKNVDLKTFIKIRDKLSLSIDDNEIKNLPYIKFKKGSEEYNYIHEKRKKLGGYVPFRLKNFTEKFVLPNILDFKSLFIKQKKKVSTTISFLKILNILLQNKFIKDRIVPIVADEARTFGMESLFRKIGIYNSLGQKYNSQDKNEFLYYKEDKKGQILQEGINELGAGSSWLAAATSYSNNNLPMIPFYIYYSIFGFQRIGDLFWAAGDQQARGFLIGAVSGRTTLNGEGLQHGDGHSHIQSLTIPNCISFDPAYSYELATIINNGISRMYGSKQENIYYYITVTNEKYNMPKMPKNSEYGICKGIYKLKRYKGNLGNVQLLGSGSILNKVCIAGKILYKEYNISSDIYSVTSFTELARDGQDCDRWNMLNLNSSKKKRSYVSKIMNDSPAIASTDYMKLFAEQIRKYIPSKKYIVLGTDGFAKSDSRKNLRHYFEIDEFYIVISALIELYEINVINKNVVLDAIKKFKINPNKINPRL